MRSAAVGLVASLTLIAGQALAADLPSAVIPLAPIPMAETTFNWSGFYVGAQVGHSWGHDSTIEYWTGTDTLTGDGWKYPTKGFMGGVFAGYNYELNSIVVGAEADIEAADLRGRFVDTATGIGAGTVRTEWQGSLRARLGFSAFDRTLIYATGGAAFADRTDTYYNLISGAREPVQDVKVGWTIGGGLEYALTDNITVRTEYRYTDFGSYRNESKVAFPPGWALPATPAGLTGEQSPYQNDVRVGVAYKF